MGMALGAIIRSVLRFMKKKLNFWTINFFLTAVASFLFNGGVFAEHTGAIPLSKGGMGTIKLSGKNPSTHVRGRSSIASHPFREHLGQGNNRIRIQQKGERWSNN